MTILKSKKHTSGCNVGILSLVFLANPMFSFSNNDSRNLYIFISKCQKKNGNPEHYKFNVMYYLINTFSPMDKAFNITGR